MFKLLSSIALIGSLAIYTIATPPVNRDVAALQADITAIADAYGPLKSHLTAFQGGVVQGIGALIVDVTVLVLSSTGQTLKSDVVNIKRLLAKTLTDVPKTPGIISESDLKSAYSIYDFSLHEQIIEGLDLLRSKKPAFVSLNEKLPGVYNEVYQDIVALQNLNQVVADGMIAIAPVDWKANATQAKTEVDAAFEMTKAAYGTTW